MPLDVTDAVTKDARLAEGLSNLRAPMTNVQKHVEACIDRRFEEQSDGDAPWKPLSPLTIHERARLGYGAGPILQRDETLRGSMVGEADEQSAEVGPDEGQAPYAKYHAGREGGGDGEKIPRRDFLRLTSSEEDEAIEIIDTYLATIE